MINTSGLGILGGDPLTGGLLQVADVAVTVNPSTHFQSIIGFGGAFTDAAVETMSRGQSAGARQRLIDAYFGEGGKRALFFGRPKIVFFCQKMRLSIHCLLSGSAYFGSCNFSTLNIFYL